MSCSFGEHVELLSQLLDRRPAIVDRIESTLLNVRDKPAARIRQRDYFDRLLKACFFDVPGLPPGLSRLKGQLAATHLADGFEPVVLDRHTHELDPLELVVRAYEHWDRHRWPGKSGRTTYAQVVYAVALLRDLEHLSLRIWDDGPEDASDRLQDVQHLLDRLNAPAGTDLFVRDARWLIQTAQGPLTRHTRPYFTIARQIADSFTGTRRVGIHDAGARLAGGHLRSQLRYRAWEAGRAIDDPDVLAVTRNSNSMDMALLIHDLVPLLEAYDASCGARHEDEDARLDLADAILQGLSADPELFLTRLDLLGPSCTIEELFVDWHDGRPRLTALGEWHRGVLRRYVELIGRLAAPLKEDASQFDPAATRYSPLGIVYGFCADMLSNVAAAALVSQPSFGLSAEDLFASRGRHEDKLARARGWQALPMREGEHEHFEHSLEWAAQMSARLTDALKARARRPATPNASELPNGRIFVVPESHPAESLSDGFPAVDAVSAQEHCVSSDVTRAVEGVATPRSRQQMTTDWKEARFLASAERDGHRFGVSKVILTLITSRGQDAVIGGVPHTVVDVLHLTCPEIMAVPD